MQPDHEADDLQDMLRGEYGAPPLDEQFSADLIARLQAEASSPPSLTPARRRRSRLAIGLAIATFATLVFAVVWIVNPGIRATNHELARRVKTDANRLTLQGESEIEERVKHDRLDHLSDNRVGHLSVHPRSLSLSAESKNLGLGESLSDRRETESKNHSEFMAQSQQSVVTEERNPRALSPTIALLIPEIHQPEWPTLSATAALADMLYIVDSGHLYEINTSDGSRRGVGAADWRNTAAMGSCVGHLYLVCDNQLYEVNPATGARRGLGKPTWANTKAIVTVGDKLYIASNGLLHRVNPSDGSHEVLHSQNDRPNNSRQPKP